MIVLPALQMAQVLDKCEALWHSSKIRWNWTEYLVRNMQKPNISSFLIFQCVDFVNFDMLTIHI